MPAAKDILLINPWIYDFSAFDFWSRPLGLLYMGGMIREFTDHRVSFIDCLDRTHPSLPAKLKSRPDGRGPFHKEEVPKPDVLRDVPRKFSRYGLSVSAFKGELDRIPVPDVVLITCVMTYWYPGVQAVIECVRRRFGPVPVVLGGIYPTLLPEHARRSSGADVIVSGQGEDRLFPVLRDILGDPGIPSPGFASLDDLPRPAAGLMPNSETLPLLTSRGCPYSCSYCAASRLFSGFEQRSVTPVVDEIESFYLRYGIRHFAFYDDALLLNRERHIIPILEEIIRRKIDVNFHTPNGLHVKEVDSSLAPLFKAAGMRSIFLSQESFSDHVLAASDYKVSSGDLEGALSALEGAGYERNEINVYLLCGIPGQEAGDVIRSIESIFRLGANPRLSYFSPIPGTLDWKGLVKGGILEPDCDPLMMNKLIFPYVWGSITPREFEKIKETINRGAGA